MIYICIVHVIVLLQHSRCTDFQTSVVVSDFDLELMAPVHKNKNENMLILYCSAPLVFNAQ
jgi:hypothetical protein